MVKRRDGETVKGRSGEITHYALRFMHCASRITLHALRITHYAYTLSSPMPYSSAYLGHLW
ncbi:hypothetical protein B0813_001152 [Candidatus Fervidibacteria bacterium JGI MDM2 SSWTFF-3-K9]